MFFANNQYGERIHARNADKQNDYSCPICDRMVRPRQGELNQWHFSHPKNGCDDSWHYDMSEWHTAMQNLFPHEYQEIIISNPTTKHRADVSKDKTVIEFQHSSMKKSEFDDRNSFFLGLDYRVAWVFDAIEATENGRFTWENPNGSTNGNHGDSWHRWKFPLRMLRDAPEVSGKSKKFALWLCVKECGTDQKDYGLIRINAVSGVSGAYDFSWVKTKDELLWTSQISDVDDFFQVWENKPVVEFPFVPDPKPDPLISVWDMKFPEKEMCPYAEEVNMDKLSDPPKETVPETLIEQRPVISAPVHRIERLDPFSRMQRYFVTPQAADKPDYETNDGWYPEILTETQVEHTAFLFRKNQFWTYFLKDKVCGIPGNEQSMYQCEKTTEFFKKEDFHCHLCKHCALIGIQKQGGVRVACAFPSVVPKKEIVEIVNKKQESENKYGKQN